MAITWDTSVLPFQNVMFARRNLSRSGGLTLSGVEQVVQSSSDFWTAQITTKIRNEEQRLAYRAYQALNWGRSGEWIIPVCTGRTLIDVGGGLSSGFSSGFETATSSGVSVDIVGRVVGTVADQGTTSILFRVEAVGYEGEAISWQPKAGMYFSIGSRLYLIGQVTGPIPGRPGTFSASFAPKLRNVAPLDTVMEFTKPHCLMRLADDNIGQMNLDMLRFADVSLNFVEVPTISAVTSTGGGGGVGSGDQGGAIITETWSSTDKSSRIAISGLTATLTSGFTDCIARSSHTRSAGYFETVFASPARAGIGFANSLASLDNFLGADQTGVMYAYTGDIVFWNAQWGVAAPYGPGDAIGAELSAGAIKFYKNGTLQYTMDRTISNNSPPGSLYAAIDLNTTNDAGTANFGATAMAHLPSGVVSWDGSRTG